jgi:hypothetical protein
MVRVIREMVTVSADHEVRLQNPDIPAGSRVEVMVIVGDEAKPAQSGSIWDIVAEAQGKRSAESIIAQVRKDRDEWDGK